MASKLAFLQQRYAESTFDRTWQGRLFVLMRHLTGFYCIFRTLIVRPCIPCTLVHDKLTQTLSVPLKHLPSRPPPYHPDRVSPIPRSPRLRPPTTHTAHINRNRGECHLCDPSGEPRPCWRRHHRLHPACPAWRSARASCHPRVTKSRRLARFARACAINGTCPLSARYDGRTNNAGVDRAYTYSRRSYNFALRSRLRRMALAQGYLRRFRLMRLSDWCSIGASLRAPPLLW
jgi:hypothetical protein